MNIVDHNQPINPSAMLIRKVITMYQRTLSPDHGPLRHFFPHGVCRFSPTCSEYLAQALEQHGVNKGLQLGAARLCRCHPYAAGGHDPVPRPRAKATP